MATATDPEPQRTELAPFREQEPFLQRDKKYYGYVSGVGAGKTYAGVLRVALNMEEWNPGEMGAIVAPTTTMVKDVILPLIREMGLLDHWEYKSQHTEEPGIHAPNGARALILSADNQRQIERLAGLNLAWWWVDEEARVAPRAREILTQRLRVGSYRNGFITTTPMGRNHTYDFFVGDVDGELYTHGEADVYEAADRLAILRVPTHANPHTPEDYKEQIDRDHEGQTYEQEVLGKFVEYEGLVYPWFGNLEDHDHVVDRPPNENVQRHIYGVDWGHANPSVVLCIGQLAGGRYVVLDEFYEPRVTNDDLAQVIHGMHEAYQPGPVYCDPSEPRSIEALQREGIDAVAAENDVLPGIQHVSSLRADLQVVQRCQALVNEFNLYRYPDNEDSETPVKANDHALDALRYALFTDEGGLETSMEGMDFI